MVESLQKINHHLSLSDYMDACNVLRNDYPMQLRVFAALKHYDRVTKTYDRVTSKEVFSESI